MDGRALGGILLDTQLRGLVFSPESRFLYTANANGSSYQLEVGRLLKR
jgi:hypothetical protein